MNHSNFFPSFVQNCSTEFTNFQIKTHPHTQSNVSLLNPFSVVSLKVHAYTLKIHGNFPKIIHNHLCSTTETPQKQKSCTCWIALVKIKFYKKGKNSVYIQPIFLENKYFKRWRCRQLVRICDFGTRNSILNFMLWKQKLWKLKTEDEIKLLYTSAVCRRILLLTTSPWVM